MKVTGKKIGKETGKNQGENRGTDWAIYWSLRPNNILEGNMVISVFLIWRDGFQIWNVLRASTITSSVADYLGASRRAKMV